MRIAEELADDLHALEQVVVDDVERLHALGEREVEVSVEPLELAVLDTKDANEVVRYECT